MKMLLFHQYYLDEVDSGGGRWNEMARIWQELGHEVTVVAGMIPAHGMRKHPDYQGKFHTCKVQNRITVHRTHVSASYNRNFNGRLWGYLSFLFSSLWVALFRINERFDVIICTSPPLFAGISAYLTSLIKKVPMVFEVRDLWPESAIDLGIVTNPALLKVAFSLERFLYKHSVLVNVVTPGLYRVLLAEKQVPADKLTMVPNAADFRLVGQSLEGFDRDHFRALHGFTEYFVVIYVGAHGVANDLSQLLEVGKRLEDSNVLFVLLGDGMEKAKLVERARVTGITNVRFLDAVPKADVFKYICAADIGVSILRNCDTFKTVFSNKTFDYMSCKKPVIMGIDGLSRELIEEAKAGTYVNPANVEEFASLVKGYQKDPRRIQQEGERGYAFVRQNFDRERLARTFLNEIQARVGNLPQTGQPELI
jgi:glycosyltransferase involved in cell wall biosynthesis